MTNREAIIAAAAELLRQQGSTAVTTRAVAQAAGVQAPAIYRLFGDKDGLLDAVAEHVYAEHVAAKTRDLAEEAALDPVEVLRRGWQVYVDFGLANPELFALLNQPERSRRSPASLAGIAALRTRVHRLAVAGRLAVDEDTATRLIRAAGSGTVLVLLADDPQRRDDALAETVFAVLCRSLLVEQGEAPSTVSDRTRTTATAVAMAAITPTLPGLTERERELMGEWLERAIAALAGTPEVRVQNR